MVSFKNQLIFCAVIPLLSLISILFALFDNHNFLYSKLSGRHISFSEKLPPVAIRAQKLFSTSMGPSLTKTSSQKYCNFLVRKINTLFPLNASYLYLDERSSQMDLKDRIFKRMQLLRNFCNSGEYKKKKSTKYVATTERSDITLIEDFKSFECRTPKTGYYIHLFIIL